MRRGTPERTAEATRLAPLRTLFVPSVGSDRSPMSLVTDLHQLIEQSCHTAWSPFDWIKAHATLYSLSRRTSDK